MVQRGMFLRKVNVKLCMYIVKKAEFLKERQFCLVALAFQYGNCLNASLSRCTLKIYFVFKKLILKNNRSKPVLITP